MKKNFPDDRSTSHDELFAALRAKLKSEVSGSAMLTDLLQKVNGMQEVSACPAEFKSKFDEFVGRAEEYSTNLPVLSGFRWVFTRPPVGPGLQVVAQSSDPQSDPQNSRSYRDFWGFSLPSQVCKSL